MTKQFVEKVIRNGIVDTKKYRYTTKEVNYYSEAKDAYIQELHVVRLPLDLLDTTAALTEWETVYIEEA